MVKKEVNVVERFWNKYIKADNLRRKKIIETTKLFERIYPMLKSDLDIKTKKFIFTSSIQSYLDDLIDVLNHRNGMKK